MTRALQVMGLLLALATAGVAQDGLVGTWHHSETDEEQTAETRLMLRADGTATLHMLAKMQGSLLDQADLEPDGPPDTMEPDATQPDTTTIEVDGSGTWLAADGRLSLTLTQQQLRINGAPFAEAINIMAQTLAQSLADLLEVPEADRPALYETIRITLQTELDEDELLAELVQLLQSGIAYELAGDRLLLDDGEGGVETWTRQQITAVRNDSWATIKRALSRSQ